MAQLVRPLMRATCHQVPLQGHWLLLAAGTDVDSVIHRGMLEFCCMNTAVLLLAAVPPVCSAYALNATCQTARASASACQLYLQHPVVMVNVLFAIHVDATFYIISLVQVRRLKHRALHGYYQCSRGATGLLPVQTMLRDLGVAARASAPAQQALSSAMCNRDLTALGTVCRTAHGSSIHTGRLRRPCLQRTGSHTRSRSHGTAGSW